MNGCCVGYDNEEAVKLKDLRPSLGEESITEQLRKAAEEKDLDEEDYDEEDGIEDDVSTSWFTIF